MIGLCKLSVLLAVAISTQSASSLAKPPPGFAPERDKDASKYKYEYSVLDGLGGHSGRVESRDGPHTLGGYFVSVPMGHNAMAGPMGPSSLQQTVSFITDSWGYHPIVSYTTNHGSAVTTAQFALGGKAVAALRQQEEQQQEQQKQQQQQQAAAAAVVASGEPSEPGVPATSLLAPAAPLPMPSATLIPPALSVSGDGPGPASAAAAGPAGPGKLLPGLLQDENAEAELAANDIGGQGGQRGVQVTSFLADTNTAGAPSASGPSAPSGPSGPSTPASEDGGRASVSVGPSLKGADSISAYVISDSDERGNVGNGLADRDVTGSSTALPPTPTTTLQPIVVSENYGGRVPSTTPSTPSSYSPLFGPTVTVTPESAPSSSPASVSSSAFSSLGTTATDDAAEPHTGTASTPTVVITPRPQHGGQHGAQDTQQVAAASNAFEVTDDGHQYLGPSGQNADDEQQQQLGDEELQQEQQKLQDGLKKDMTITKSSAVHEAHYRTEVEVQKSVEVPSEITLDSVKLAGDEEHVQQRGSVHAPGFYIRQHQNLMRQQQHVRELEEEQQRQQRGRALQQEIRDQHEQDLQDQMHAQQLQDQQIRDEQRGQDLQDQLHVQQLQDQQIRDQQIQDLQRVQQLQDQQIQDHQRAQQLQDQQIQDQQIRDQQIQDHQRTQQLQDQQYQNQQNAQHHVQLPVEQLQDQQADLLQLQEDPQDLDLQQSVADTQPHHVQLLQPLTLQLPLHMLQQAHFPVVHEALLLQQQAPPPPPQQELQDAVTPNHGHGEPSEAAVIPEENKLQLEALVQQVAADVTRLVRVEDQPAAPAPAPTSTKLVEVEKTAPAPIAHGPHGPHGQHGPPAEQVTRLVNLDRPYTHPAFMAMQYPVALPGAHPMHHLLPFQHYIALPIKDLQLSESQVQSQQVPHQSLHHKYKISHAVHPSPDDVTALTHKAVPGIDPDKIVHCAEHVYSFRPSHTMYPAHWKGRSSRRGGPPGGPGGAPGRHRGNLRKLCIEYGGFKPPLVPSTPIKEDGKPVHPSKDD